MKLQEFLKCGTGTTETSETGFQKEIINKNLPELLTKVLMHFTREKIVFQ